MGTRGHRLIRCNQGVLEFKVSLVFFVSIVLFLICCFLLVLYLLLLKHFLGLSWQSTFRGMLESAHHPPARLIILARFCWSFDREDLFQQIFHRLFDFFLHLNWLTGHRWLLEDGRDRVSRCRHHWRLSVYYKSWGITRIVVRLLLLIHGRVRRRGRLLEVMKHGCRRMSKHGCRRMRRRSKHVRRRVRRRSRNNLRKGLVVLKLAGVSLLALISISALLFKVFCWHF